MLLLITALVAARPTYGYRRITAILNRQLRAEGLAPVNHKRVYRILQAQNLLLARRYTERPEHVHDGKVIVMRSNLRWCSDGFEFTCWNGDIVRGAFIIDATTVKSSPGAPWSTLGSAVPTSATSCSKPWNTATARPRSSRSCPTTARPTSRRTRKSLPASSASNPASRRSRARKAMASRKPS